MSQHVRDMTREKPASSAASNIRTRILCVGFGFFILLVLEGICRWMGWGATGVAEDPFVTFEGGRSLFERDDRTATYRIGQGRLKWFSEESFPLAKEEGTFRIFVLGGSTVKGRPWSKETAFPAWLKLALQAQEPGRSWEVVNVGGLSYASYRLAPIFEECLRYEPDLMVLCTGHNEFLEDRDYRKPVAGPGPLMRGLSRSRLVRLYARGLQALRATESRTPSRNRWVLGGEVEALLDYKGGLEAYVKDAAWHEQVTRHFETNLLRMAEMSMRQEVPLILMLPPSNLLDCPPFKSEADPSLSLADKLEMESLMETLVSQAVDEETYLEASGRLTELDPGFAMGLYLHGRRLFTAGRVEESRAFLVAARDQDVCPLRMPSALEEAMRRVARLRRIPLLDAHAYLSRTSVAGIPGDLELADHIHPRISGHRMLAWELLRGMGQALGWPTLPDSPPVEVEEAWDEYQARIPDRYFLEAELALEGLNNWARGRVEGWGLESHRYRVKQRNADSSDIPSTP